METIQFYKVNDVYGEFSNFAKSPVLIECEIGLPLNIISKQVNLIILKSGTI